MVPLMTPRGSTPRGSTPLWQHWGPSAAALAGIALLVGNGAAGPIGSMGGAATAAVAAGGPPDDMMAVALSLGSALFFAVHTLRTEEYADVEPMDQAAGQVRRGPLPLAAEGGRGAASIFYCSLP
eukprot:1436780-Prymnesium_polylepis.1